MDSAQNASDIRHARGRPLGQRSGAGQRYLRIIEQVYRQISQVPEGVLVPFGGLDCFLSLEWAMGIEKEAHICGILQREAQPYAQCDYQEYLREH